LLRSFSSLFLHAPAPSGANASALIGLRFACTFYGIFAFTTFLRAGLPRIDADRSE
jgi:hypothetical protein